MDLDLLVVEADPARHADLPGPDSPEAARLYRQITAPAPRSRRMRRAAPVAAGLMAAAAAAALVLVNLPGGAGPGSPGPGSPGPGSPGRVSVTAILDAAAVAASHGEGASQPPGPGQYLYVQEISVKGLSDQPTQACPEAPMNVRAWVAADGSGRQAGTFPARCARLDFDKTYAKGGLPWWLYGVVQAGTLPTRPEALQKAIVARFEDGRSLPSATFVYAATFLNAGSSAALRAALYRVIESLPGVQNLGPATDRLGRHGQAVGLVTSGTRDELLFDPATTMVLEEETVAVPPEQSGNNQLSPGTVLQYTEYLRAGVVKADTAIAPSGPGTPVPSGSDTAIAPSGPGTPVPSRPGTPVPSTPGTASTRGTPPAPTATPPSAGTS